MVLFDEIVTGNNCDSLRFSKRRLVGKSKSNKRKNRRRYVRNRSILKNNVVFNFSKHVLNVDEISVLNKGFGFVPSFIKPKFIDIDRDFKRFERRLQLHLFFSGRSQDEHATNKPLFESNRNWWPPILNGHITDFCYKLKRDFFNCFKRTGFMNLSVNEIKALKALKANTGLIIKKCDKGGGIAVMDNEFYLPRITNMLNDCNTYCKTNFDDTVTVKHNADELFIDLFDNGFINRKQLSYFTAFSARCPIFYGLPKVHKTNVPLRPIVSQINGPTCKINELVDRYLFFAEKNIPYLLQDTTAFLNLIEKHKQCLPNTILVTLDVASLYTNIPHDEGVQWVCDFYEETLDHWDLSQLNLNPIDKSTLAKLMLFILDNCTFEFNGEYYKQNFGTTMGAKFSVKFANIYMYMWFRHFLPCFNGTKPQFIARLIDDCFFLWNDTEASLIGFLEYLNSCHSSIKFEWHFSTDKVTFLDTLTFIENGLIRTSIYVKPTDKKQYLFFKSNHPAHIFSSIPYSQALRYRRIIDDDDRLSTELAVLKNRFVNRGYPSQLLDIQFRKATNIVRTHLLQYKTVEAKKMAFSRFLKGHSFLPLIVNFHRSPMLKMKLNERWTSFINCDQRIFDVFHNELPQLVFKRGTTIANILTSTRFRTRFDVQDRENVVILKSLLAENVSNVWFCVSKCQFPTCKCCRHIRVGSSYQSSNREETFYVENNFNCNSSDVIYVINCDFCGVLYVGQTSRQLKDRLNNHRSDVKLLKNTAVAKHFNEPGHFISHLKIMPIFDLTGLPVFRRIEIENDFMKSLNTRYPIGLNYYPLLR